VIGAYIYNFARGVDQLGNALMFGNSRQTMSSRGYEAAVLARLWYWCPFYWGVNGVMYTARWLFARPFGYRWGADMPVNHCFDAYMSFPNIRTYAGPF
jgi:hypothetical protein